MRTSWTRSIKPRTLAPKQLLLDGDFVSVVVIILSAVKEGELGIVLLFLLCHRLKLWAIPRHKGSQLINDVPDLHIIWRPWEVHDKDLFFLWNKK